MVCALSSGRHVWCPYESLELTDRLEGLRLYMRIATLPFREGLGLGRVFRFRRDIHSALV